MRSHINVALGAVIGVVGSIAVSGILAGCGSSDADESRRALLASWGEHVILPLYRDVEDNAAALHDSGDALCQAATTETLEAARSAWSDARAPWKQTEVLAFGPYHDEPLRIGPKIDFWPARVEAIQQILLDPDLQPIAPDGLGAPQKGFPVIEYLLFQPDIDVVASFAGFDRRCEYLTVVTGDLAAQAAAMREAWDPAKGDFLAELVDAGRTSTTFETLNLALSEIVNRMAFTVENIRADKLGRPLGTAIGSDGGSGGGSPQPDKAESRFSDRSLDDIRDNLLGIERLYFGDGSADSLGLDSYARERGQDFTDTMTERLARARAALDAITLPLTRAVLDEPAQVTESIERLGDLQRLIQVDIIGALSLTPSFNDNDGD